ncbi:unnamed protein product [Cylindrotheca closterium]|uniref:RING-type domain-containing protein n=1 Tax=Cylindrotheca closterium TaxID=2856 RepID=A0AAD2CTN5_9STRA|nr:unnamed protein product [Cylindrotheca closterium]
MIFIWSSNGGPMQHAVMLILFLVQLLPFLLNNETNFEHSTTTSSSRPVTSAPPQQTSNNNIINRNTRTAAHRYSASYTVTTDDLPWKTLALTFLVFFIVIFSLLAVSLNQYRVWLRSRYENIAQNIEERQAREMQEPQQQPQPNQQNQQQPPNQQQPLRDAYEQSSRYWLSMGLASGLVCGIFVWGMFFNDVKDSALSQSLSDIALFLGSMLQFAGFVWMMTRSFADARHHQGHQQPPQQNPAKLAKIVAKIRELPIEEFVPNDEEAYSKLKISQLKGMLQNRGDTASYLERNEIVSCLMKQRKFDDSCCICYEDYHCHPTNDEEQKQHEHIVTFLRILPRCGHEFHLECLDQWAYTFERKAEAPSCPLCKTEF